ncbi:MAG: hypothetical protein OXC95_11670, partial [Dehalococcoidia bacterium]|nr:hypothetical protein [Dehalococcoidia bacterium]
LALAQEDLSALGEGHVPLTGRGGPSAEQPGEAVRSRMSIIIVAVAAIALLAGGIAAYAVVRRR